MKKIFIFLLVGFLSLTLIFATPKVQAQSQGGPIQDGAELVVYNYLGPSYTGPAEDKGLYFFWNTPQLGYYYLGFFSYDYLVSQSWWLSGDGDIEWEYQELCDILGVGFTWNQGFGGFMSGTRYDHGSVIKEAFQLYYLEIGNVNEFQKGYDLGYYKGRQEYGINNNGTWYSATQWGDIRYGEGQASEFNFLEIMITGIFSFITAIGNIEILPGLKIAYIVGITVVFGIIFFIIGKKKE